MSETRFVRLHNHSAYSLSEGAIKAEKLAALAAAEGMPAVAITDSSNLFGALEFSQAAAGEGAHPDPGPPPPPAARRPAAASGRADRGAGARRRRLCEPAAAILHLL